MINRDIPPLSAIKKASDVSAPLGKLIRARVPYVFNQAGMYRPEMSEEPEMIWQDFEQEDVEKNEIHEQQEEDRRYTALRFQRHTTPFETRMGQEYRMRFTCEYFTRGWARCQGRWGNLGGNAHTGSTKKVKKSLDETTLLRIQ